MLPPIHLPCSTAGVAIAAVQCLNLAAFANEAQAPTGYSKFAPKDARIPSRRGMAIIYTPALITAMAMVTAAPAVNGREALVASMVAIHFAKRVAEVFFVHKYSGHMGPMCYVISTFYSLLTLLICVMGTHAPRVESRTYPRRDLSDSRARVPSQPIMCRLRCTLRPHLLPSCQSPSASLPSDSSATSTTTCCSRACARRRRTSRQWR